MTDKEFNEMWARIGVDENAKKAADGIPAAVRIKGGLADELL